MCIFVLLSGIDRLRIWEGIFIFSDRYHVDSPLLYVAGSIYLYIYIYIGCQFHAGSFRIEPTGLKKLLIKFELHSHLK